MVTDCPYIVVDVASWSVVGELLGMGISVGEGDTVIDWVKFSNIDGSVPAFLFLLQLQPNLPKHRCH